MILTQVAAVVLALVLVIAAAGKFQDDDASVKAEWEDFKIPAVLNQRWLRSLHPFIEIVLAVGIIAFPWWLRVLAAIGAFVLVLAYLVMIISMYRRPEETSCACFGAKETTKITFSTVIRNLLLVVLAVFVVAGAVMRKAPALWWGNPVETFEAVLIGVVAFATGWYSAIRTPVSETSDDKNELTPQQSPFYNEEGDYIRTLTPQIDVLREDGQKMTLVQLASQRPQLLLFMSVGCGGCESVGERIADYRERLPQVDVRVVNAQPTDDLLSQRPTWGPLALQDIDHLASRTLQIYGTPGAVLLGVDGMLAAGPSMGAYAIDNMVKEIEEALNEIADEVDSLELNSENEAE